MVFHLMVIAVRGWSDRIGGDGIDVGSPDDPHPGPSAVLHTHADAYGNSSNDPHDKYDSEHDAGNGCAREDIPNISVVGATIGRGPITAVRSALFATLSKAGVCVENEQDQLRKHDPWTHGQPLRVHPSRWPEVARPDNRTDRRTDRSEGWERRGSPEREGAAGRSDGELCAPEKGDARSRGHRPGSLRGEPGRPALSLSPSAAPPESGATGTHIAAMPVAPTWAGGGGGPGSSPRWEQGSLLQKLFLTLCCGV